MGIVIDQLDLRSAEGIRLNVACVWLKDKVLRVVGVVERPLRLGPIPLALAAPRIRVVGHEEADPGAAHELGQLEIA